MKKGPFIILFVSVNLFFLFFQINKQSRLVKLSFEQQRLEKTKSDLLDQKQKIKHELFRVQQTDNIKKYACHELGMEKMKLSQVKQITGIQPEERHE